jgi:hypothetical protein
MARKEDSTPEQRLSPQERRGLMLHYATHTTMSWAEIQEKLGMTAGQLRVDKGILEERAVSTILYGSIARPRSIPDLSPAEKWEKLTAAWDEERAKLAEKRAERERYAESLDRYYPADPDTKAKIAAVDAAIAAQKRHPRFTGIHKERGRVANQLDNSYVLPQQEGRGESVLSIPTSKVSVAVDDQRGEGAFTLDSSSHELQDMDQQRETEGQVDIFLVGNTGDIIDIFAQDSRDDRSARDDDRER